MKATIYSVDTGQILRVFTGPQDWLAAQIGAGEAYLEGDFSDADFHIVEGAAVERPGLDAATEQEATAGETITVATGLPAETFVAVNGIASGVIDDGVLEYQPAAPGTVTIRLTPVFPYKPAVITVTVHEVEPV